MHKREVNRNPEPAIHAGRIAGRGVVPNGMEEGDLVAIRSRVTLPVGTQAHRLEAR